LVSLTPPIDEFLFFQSAILNLDGKRKRPRFWARLFRVMATPFACNPGSPFCWYFARVSLAFCSFFSSSSLFAFPGSQLPAPDLPPWIRTELIRISGSGGEEDGQE
jgi:hypothetical protein